MTLEETLGSLAKSRRPSDLAVAAFLRKNAKQIALWLLNYNGAGKEDVLQVMLLAVCEALQNLDGEGEALKSVRNAMQRSWRREKNWKRRKMPLNGNEDEVYASEEM